MKEPDIVKFSAASNYPIQSNLWIYQTFYTLDDIKIAFKQFSVVKDLKALLQCILSTNDKLIFNQVWGELSAEQKNKIHGLLTSNNYKLLRTANNNLLPTIIYSVLDFHSGMQELIYASELTAIGNMQITIATLSLTRVLSINDMSSLFEQMPRNSQAILKRAFKHNDYNLLRTGLDNQAIAWVIQKLFQDREDQLELMNCKIKHPIIVFEVLNIAFSRCRLEQKSEADLKHTSELLKQLIDKIYSVKSNIDLSFVCDVFSHDNYYLFEKYPEFNDDSMFENNLELIVKDVFPASAQKEKIYNRVLDNTSVRNVLLTAFMFDECSDVAQSIHFIRHLDEKVKLSFQICLASDNFKLLRNLAVTRFNLLPEIIATFFLQTKNTNATLKNMLVTNDANLLAAFAIADTEKCLQIILTRFKDVDVVKSYFDMFKKNEKANTLVWEVLSSKVSCGEGLLPYGITTGIYNVKGLRAWFFNEFVVSNTQKEELWANGNRLVKIALLKNNAYNWLQSDLWSNERIIKEILALSLFQPYSDLILLRFKIPKLNCAISEYVTVDDIRDYSCAGRINERIRRETLELLFSQPAYQTNCYMNIIKLFECSEYDQGHLQLMIDVLQELFSISDNMMQVLLVEGQYRYYKVHNNMTGISDFYRKEISDCKSKMLDLFVDSDDTDMKVLKQNGSLTIMDYQEQTSSLMRFFRQPRTLAEEIETRENYTGSSLCG